MATRPSRAYKLKLSERGISLFLDCHCRLCHLAGDFLPYGTTLRVAVTLLSATSVEKLGGEIACGDLAGFAGKTIRFVGTSPSLAKVTALLIARLAASSSAALGPPTWLIFIAALSAMRSVDDATLLGTYDGLQANDANKVAQHSLGSDDAADHIAKAE